MNKDLIDNAAHWHLGLLIGAKGIDVLAHRTVGEPAVVSGHIAYDAAARSLAEAVEEAVYANPMLLLPFRSCSIVVRADRSVILPADVDSDMPESILTLDEGLTAVTNPISPREKLVFYIPRPLANFITRTFEVTPRHPLAVMASYQNGTARRGTAAKVMVEIAPDKLEVLITNNLGLVTARTFDLPNPSFAAYWVLAAFRDAGLDADEDRIFIAGPAAARRDLQQRLQAFVNSVMPAIVPSAAYHGDTKALAAPYSLLISPLCE